MKEIRVYIVNADMYEGEEYICDLSNEAFMAIAEEQGTVYSLKGFEWSYNNEDVDTINTYMRIIEVECEESINFEEWEIPFIKLNS